MKWIESFKIFESEDERKIHDPGIQIRELVNSMIETVCDSLYDIFDEYDISEIKDDVYNDIGEIEWSYLYFNDNVNKEKIEISLPRWGTGVGDKIGNRIYDEISKLKPVIEKRIDNRIAFDFDYDNDSIVIRIPDLSLKHKKDMRDSKYLKESHSEDIAIIKDIFSDVTDDEQFIVEISERHNIIDIWIGKDVHRNVFCYNDVKDAVEQMDSYFSDKYESRIMAMFGHSRIPIRHLNPDEKCISFIEIKMMGQR